MDPKMFIAVILATGALALGTAGLARAHDAAPVEEQCGAQGEQATEEHDDAACGADAQEQAGDQGEKQTGQQGENQGDDED